MQAMLAAVAVMALVVGGACSSSGSSASGDHGLVRVGQSLPARHGDELHRRPAPAPLAAGPRPGAQLLGPQLCPLCRGDADPPGQLPDGAGRPGQVPGRRCLGARVGRSSVRPQARGDLSPGRRPPGRAGGPARGVLAAHHRVRGRPRGGARRPCGPVVGGGVGRGLAHRRAADRRRARSSSRVPPPARATAARRRPGSTGHPRRCPGWRARRCAGSRWSAPRTRRWRRHRRRWTRRGWPR